MSFDSLYTGITGLNAYQSWIDMISNNIANVDTTGFKGQRMTFADLFYQNQGFASGPTTTSGGVNPQQIGVGVKVNSIDTLFGQGGLQTTGVNTDLALNGDGFFILRNLNGTSAPTYTRDGAFSLNSNGVLYDPASGLAVQGWEADTNGNITRGTPGNIVIPVGLQEQATATGAGVKVGPNGSDQVFDVALGGNLDQTQWQQSFLKTIGASQTSGGIFTVSTTMYDSLGNAHEADITYTPDTTGANPATVTAGGAGQNITPVPGLITSGSISLSDNISTTVKVTSTVAGANGTYTLTDTQGNSTTAAAGSTVTFDGATLTLATPAPVAGTNSSFTIAAATNGLPSSVNDASGKAITPATRWQVNVSFTDGTTFQTLSTPGEITAAGVVTAPGYGNGSSGVVGYAYFDQNGQFINSSAIEGDTGDPPGTAYTIGANAIDPTNNDLMLHSTGSTPVIDQGNQLNVTLWGTSAGNNASAPTAGPPGVATPGPIGLDYGGTALNGGLASLAGSYSANVLSQNGFAAGTLSNITVGQDGTITGAFTNGQQKTLAQVAVATFSNEDGLSRDGGNMFTPTNASGLALVGQAGQGRFGSIQSGALEQSNVSLASEFVNLIVAQRAFEANTRGITTGDQNLQTIINLRASEN